MPRSHLEELFEFSSWLLGYTIMCVLCLTWPPEPLEADPGRGGADDEGGLAGRGVAANSKA